MRNPKDFDPNTFRRTKGGTIRGRIKVPATIGIIWGKLKGKAKPSDPVQPQSLRFSIENWTVQQAKKWLKDNNIKPILFEPATESKRKANAMAKRRKQIQATTQTMPTDFVLHAQASLEAAKGDGEKKLRRFMIKAYNGGKMILPGWPSPVVVDLAGLNVGSKSRPVLKDHNSSLIIGHTDQINLGQSSLDVSGVISGVGAVVQEVVASADNGFPWQASIGGRTQKMIFVAEGKIASANGKEFKGPVYIARKARLAEISFVSLGADDNTSAKIAASVAQKNMEVMAMEFEKWVEKQGFVLAELDENQTASLKAIYDADIAASDEPTDEPQPGPQLQLGPQEEAVATMRAEAAAESTRISAIRKVCAGQHSEIEAKAIGEGWSVTKTELEVLRASRPSAPAIHERNNDIGTQVLEAAALMTGGIAGDKLLSTHGEQTVELADKRFRHGIGLQQLLLEAAWANGCDLRFFRDDPEQVLRAAFSTLSLPGILSNVANKFLLDGFEAVEQAWQQIAATRSVKDFKTVTSYRLTGGFEYEEVGPGGELQHATVGEESFTNQAKTYGRMFSVTRTDLINDDLGALTIIPRRIGRGASLKLNKVFWTAFLNNSAFFTAGRNNYAEGTATALSIDSLTSAETLFLNQTDPDGYPLALSPAILLVPPALKVTAELLKASLVVNETTTANKPKPANNPHAGKFEPVVSTYLSNSAISGNSALAWYLLAKPADLAVIEVAFLNGKGQPTVEQAEADFNVLGIQFRGYFDFGVALQDYRAGNKQKGEA